MEAIEKSGHKDKAHVDVEICEVQTHDGFPMGRYLPNMNC